MTKSVTDYRKHVLRFGDTIKGSVYFLSSILKSTALLVGAGGLISLRLSEFDSLVDYLLSFYKDTINMTFTNVEKLFAKVDYGPIKCGKEYRILESGRDWYKVQTNGRRFYCPQWVFD